MGKELSSNNLRIVKEQQIINKLRYTKVELKKYQKVKEKVRQHQVPVRPNKLCQNVGRDPDLKRRNA